MTNVNENQEVMNAQDELFFIRTYDRSGIGGDEFRYIVVWNNTKKMIETLEIYAWTCFGEGGHDYVTKPMNDEIKAMVEEYRTNQFNAQVEKEMVAINKEIDAFNEAKPYQRLGQSVEVFKGKNKGFSGKVFWEGNDTFKRSSSSNLTYNQSTILAIIDNKVCKASKCDRIGIKDLDGKVVFTSTSNCKVTNNFEPMSITRERVEEIVRRRNENWKAFWGER